jgi:hypothetical protein
MITNSKFSSLSLVKKAQWKAPFDEDVCYIQKFASGEEIRIQFISSVTGFRTGYIDKSGHDVPVDVSKLYSAGDGHLFEIVFTVSMEGEYAFYIMGSSFYNPEAFAEGGSAAICGNVYTARFAIKSFNELCDTVLVSYTHRRDEYDTEFSQRVFNFRIEGGIYPGDRTQGLDNEVFRDQRFMPHQITAETYEVSVLTVGTGKGVPQWVGRKINDIFKLSDVRVDGVRTVRNEGSAPELIRLGVRYPLYVFKLNIEQPDEDVVCPTGACGVFVTFHGNGGKTADNRQVIGVLTPEGVKWADVPKPEFMKAGVPQSGFASVPGGTLIASGHVVSDNTTVYALYN